MCAASIWFYLHTNLRHVSTGLDPPQADVKLNITVLLGNSVHTSSPRSCTQFSAIGTNLSSIWTRRMLLSTCDRSLGSRWLGVHLCTTCRGNTKLDMPASGFLIENISSKFKSLLLYKNLGEEDKKVLIIS